MLSAPMALRRSNKRFINFMVKASSDGDLKRAVLAPRQTGAAQARTMSPSISALGTLRR